jgi:DNA-binding MarR family transcriptional regulator
VRRIAVADDSRAWLIAITPKGAEALASWRAQLADAMRPVFADLTDDDWNVLSQAAELLSSRVSVGMAAA